MRCESKVFMGRSLSVGLCENSHCVAGLDRPAFSLRPVTTQAAARAGGRLLPPSPMAGIASGSAVPFVRQRGGAGFLFHACSVATPAGAAYGVF